MNARNNKHIDKSFRFWTITIVCLLLASFDAYAIPSPDLVINLSASIAQLLGLVSVLFGGVAVSKKNKIKLHQKTKSSKTFRVLFIASVGCFVVSLLVNLVQYTGSIDAKNTRLHTNLVRKSVENGKTVGNTSLKTLSFSDQMNHKLGISTETLSEWLDRDIPLNIFDVREDAEVEGGVISGAKHIRYPDILANPDLIPDGGSNNLLLCYSGNRSSELCQDLSAQGKSCNFMIGGYEKWITESRPLNSTRTNSTKELRSISDYRNRDLLLDTPEVIELVNNEKAEFLDVRYPDDFKLDHLPDAHNITMRALSSDALKDRLNQLPKVPLIAACYDKRSCFYSQLIGLSLDRMGHDFRGRYTVPHEYYVPKGERDHVANWSAANEKATLLSLAIVPFKSLLDWLTSFSGHYVTGIFLLVLFARLGLMPLTIKAERDQIVLKTLKPKLAKLKSDYTDHPRALSKATLKTYRENKIKPVFNLLASFTQLGLLLLFYTVVSTSAYGWTQEFLWIQSASSADPLYILPVLVTTLLMTILFKQFSPLSRMKTLYMAVGAVAFFALVQTLSAAVNIYLTFSMMVLISQDFLIQGLSRYYNWDGTGSNKKGIPDDDGLIPLNVAHLIPSTGKKAARLGELIAAGYNVPDGFVFTDAITHRLTKKDSVSSGSSRDIFSNQNSIKLEKLWNQLKTDKVAVRSSGLTEDGSDTSFAGVYDSLLNITKYDLLHAVAKVHNSLSSGIAESYSSDISQDDNDSPSISNLGGVVIQRMVNAEYAGVMFTEHPANAGAILIEVVAGLGEDLVSGTVTPDSYSFGRISGSALDEQTCPIDLQLLVEMGRQLEKQFGRPQDIEWAFANGEFYLLQARDITRSICDRDTSIGHSEAERLRVLNIVQNSNLEEIVYAQNELSELLPTPTPMSATFMQDLWGAGGSTDLACQQLGIPYEVNVNSENIVVTLFGHTYINKFEEKQRLGKGPGAIAAFKLARNADQIEQHFRQYFLPALLKSCELNRALDYSRLSLSQMVSTLEARLKHFICETYVEAEIVNIATDYYWKTADAKLSGIGQDPSQYLNYVPSTAVSAAMSLITGGKVSKADVQAFVTDFGHRAPYDYELSMPRYAEDPNLVLNLLKTSGQKISHSSKIPELPENKLLRISVDRVHRFQALKEDAKHYCMLELSEIRKLLLAIDTECGLNGDIFQLQTNEIHLLSHAEGQTKAKQIMAQRKRQAGFWKAVSPPTSLTIREIESMDVSTGNVKNNGDVSGLVGKHVAGDSPVKGVVRVIQSVEQIKEFQQGEILIARMTDPQWYPLFPKARGIVTEVGGWLSHAAIVAREYNLPAVVGVSGACNQLRTGDIIEIHLDGSITQFTDQRSSNSKLRLKSPPDCVETSSPTMVDGELLPSAPVINIAEMIEKKKPSRVASREKRLERRKRIRIEQVTNSQRT